MTEVKRKVRGDAQFRGELSAASGIIWRSVLSGVVGGTSFVVFLAFMYYPWGGFAFLKLWFGWLSYSLIPWLLSPLTQLPRTDSYFAWAKDWEGTRQVRALTFAVWFVSGLATGYGSFALRRWRSNKGAEGYGLREGELRLLTPDELRGEIAARVKRFKKNPRDPRAMNYVFTPHDLTISTDKIRVPDKSMATSVGIAGESGIGKTTLINEMLEQILAAGDKAMVVDLNGSFYARFGRPGDIILSVMDKRAAAWDFWSEELPELTLASGLVEYRDDMDSSGKFFHGNGRALLAALLRQSRSLPELWELTMRPLAEVKAFLVDRQDPAKSLFDGSKEARELPAIFNIATTPLKAFLPYLGHHAKERGETEPFSVRKWVLDQEDKRAVFLVARDQDWPISKPFFQLLSHIATLGIVERDPNSEQRIWYVCDEISSVGMIPSLSTILDRGRAYSGRAVIGFQTYSQLEDAYGVRGAATIAAGFGTIVNFRMRDAELAKKQSAVFTSREVEWSRMSQSVSEKGGVSVQTEIQDRPLVSASQILALPERTAYVRLSGFPPTKLMWEAKRYEIKNPDARSMSEIPANPWLGSIPVRRYRPLRDQARAGFLDELQAAVNEFLEIYHNKGSQERLRDSVARCMRVLRDGSSVREVIDLETYELSVVTNPKLIAITAVRDVTKVSMTLPKELLIESGPQESPPHQTPVPTFMPDDSEDTPVFHPIDDEEEV